jgi:hypothetical protein
MNIFQSSTHMLQNLPSESCFWVLIIKPTRRTNFSNLFLEWNSTCFGQFLCPSSGVTHWHQDGTAVPSWSCSKAVCRTVWHIQLLVCTVKNSWWWTEELSETRIVSFQNKFEKLVHLVGFIIRICHDARSHERKKNATEISLVKVSVSIGHEG